MSEDTALGPGEAIAIVGMSGRFPGARSVEELWSNLENGIDSISHFAEAELEPSRLEAPGIRSRHTYVRARGIVEDADKFDAGFFGLTPREASMMDPQHRLFLEHAWSALESAGYDPQQYSGSIGVWGGTGTNTYFLENVLPRHDLVRAEQMVASQAMLANERDYLTTRVSYKLNLRGPSINVATACSTSLVAVCQASQALLGYQCDLALAGGAFVNSPQRRGYLYQEGAIGSPDGSCRPFDAEAAGTVFSDGVGVVVLKRLSEAIEEGDTIYAVIKGVAVNNDGSGKVSFTAPSIEGQAEVIALAQAVAGVSPATVSYVEAHGTATPLGDPIEIAALTQAFRTGTAATGFCGVGSVKGNLGHLDAAAGVAGLIKTALALHKGKLPPSLHFKSPNPKIDFAKSPFYVVDALRPWPAGSEPRRAGVSAFGVGGTNAHVVLEEAPRLAASDKPVRPHHLVVLSARTPAALEEATANLSRYLRDNPHVELADVAHTLQVGRRAMVCRRAMVGRGAADLAEALSAADATRVRTRLEPSASVKVAFLFPGQGAQHVGMARGLYRSEPTFRAELDACADAFQRHLDVDIRALIFAEGADQAAAERRLAETSITQPALFAVEYAMAQLWISWGVAPAAMIGHSLGEYVAACVAGVLTREAAAALIAARGQLLEQQPRGLMMAVRLPAGELEPHLNPDVAIAAQNAPRLTVVSGPGDSVRAVEASLSELGVGCKVLATSHAFHSAMMEGALEPFREVLGAVALSHPRLPWISCLTGDWIRPEQAVDPEYWVQQMRHPVRFSQGVRRLADDPPHILLEVGPGQTLSGLARQQRDLPSQPQVISSAGPAAEDDIPSLLDAAGRLWTCGVKVDWAALRGPQRRRRVSLPTYPFERSRHWIDPLPLPGDLGAGAPGVELSQVGEEPLGAPSPSPGEPAVAAGVAGRLGALLSSASGISVAEIDAARSFLEMGFDSLLLIQVSRALESTFGLEISFRRLLEDLPTPRALSAHIEATLPAHPTVDPQGAGSGADLPPAAVEEAGRIPLSEAQREIWAAVQMGAEASCAYNLCFALRLIGDVSVEGLRRAAQQLFDRHEALRITIDPSGEWQTVAPAHPVDIPILDVAHLPHPEKQAALDALLADEVGTPLGLADGVPARLRLVIEGRDRCVLVLTAHHIVCDGWSAWILFRELAALYAANRRGESAGLPQAEPFRSFVQAGDGAQGRERARSSQVYWESRFEGGVPVLDLPLDRSRPPAKTYRGAMETLSLDAEQSEGIKRAAARQGSTLVGFLFTAFHVLLHRLTGQVDLVVGLPVSVREGGERETLVGHATNLLPVRLPVDPQASFAGHLRAARTVLLDAMEHESVSFGALLRRLDLRWDPSRTPLVAATFNLDRGRVPPDFAGAQAEIFMPPRQHVNFELEMNVAEVGGAFALECSYNPDLMSRETIRRWLGHYSRLLAAAAVDPDTALSRLTLLTEAEFAAQREWNETRADVSRACVHELVSAQATRTPGRVAVESHAERMTYGELEDKSQILARVLRGQGVVAGDRVGVFMSRCPEMVVGLLAALKAGAAYVPMDPSFPAERLRHMLEDAGVSLLLTNHAAEPELPSRDLPVILVDGSQGPSASAPAAWDGETGRQPDDLAYVIYTSGSTGRPKGVAVTHGSLVNLLESMAEQPGLSQDDVLLSVTTLSFDIAALELFLPLIKGARVVLASRDETLDGRLLIERLHSSGATVMQATPATWRLLLEAGWQRSEGLKVLCGGEALSRDLADELLGRTGDVWNMYGPTETTVWSSTWRAEPGDGPISIGYPIRNTQLWVLDSHLGPLPVGIPGELYIGGSGVARGYWARPDLTAERFVQDPFSGDTDSRLYRTGDLARRLPDGRLECLGRIDTQVKVRGFRIELEEIEAALRDSPGVGQAAVVAQGPPGANRLAAFLVQEAGASVNSDDLRARLRQRLPAYMVPSSVVFLPRLPLTPNGKVDRKALTAMEATPPEHEAYVAPRTPTEFGMAAIWQQVLGVPRVSIYDNFFDLGGHSLLLTQLLFRVRNVWKTEILLADLTRVSTVAGQAELLERARGNNPTPQGLPEIPRLPRTPDRATELVFPASNSQGRLWFLDQLQPGSAAYNLPHAYRFEGPLDPIALERSLNAVIARHEPLRTTFISEAGTPVQSVASSLTLSLRVEDLSSLGPSERETEVLRLVSESAAAPFDLKKGPLLRARLFRLTPRSHVFSINVHHIIADGLSIRFLFEDLSALYAAFEAGRPSPLPEVAIQFADYTAWKQEFLQEAALERHLDYWRKQLGGELPIVAWPADRPRPATISGRGQRVRRLIAGKDLADALTALCRKEKATPFTGLLAVLALLIQRYTGHDDVLLGAPFANRNRPEIEKSVGYYGATVVLRTDLGGDPTFRELLGRASEVVLDAYAHQDLPFERLVEALHPSRDRRQNPFFQIMLAFQPAPDSALAFPDVEMTPIDAPPQASMFDLLVHIEETADGHVGYFTYNSDLYEAETILRLVTNFECLLKAALDAPDQRISRLPVPNDREREQVLVEWNQTQLPGRESTIPALFQEQVARTPDGVALRMGEQAFTYRELNRRANRLAHHLRALGVGPEVLVGLCLERSPDLLLGVLATLKAGGAYLPLDPVYPKDRLAFMISDSRISVLVMRERTRVDLLPGDAREVFLDDLEQELARASQEDPDLTTTPSNLAYVIYTSGSTGQPKGVQIEHRNVSNFFLGMDQRLGQEPGVWLAVTSLSFDISVLELLWTLTRGFTVVLMADEDKTSAFGDQVRTHGVTHFQCTPSMAGLLVSEDASRSALGALKMMLVGGEALSSALAEELRSALRGPLLNMYGPTETTVWSSNSIVDGAVISIGRPLANTTFYILDGRGQPSPIGAAGELLIGGAGVARGYLNRPELTAERFIPNPFGEGRLYRTGDLARYRRDGTVELLGRIDTQVKIRGHRIELGEVEAHLLEIPGVREAAVVAREDKPGDQRLVAYLVGRPPSVADLRRRLRERLPEPMLPAAFVTLEQLPLTPNGKVDRRALPAPEIGQSGEGHDDHVAPRTPTEKVLAEIWQELLGVPRVSIYDNFFDLGGHSLLSVRVVYQIERRLKKHLSVEQLILQNLAQVAAKCERSPRLDEPKTRGLRANLRRWFSRDPPR